MEQKCSIPSCPRPKNLSCFPIPNDISRKKKWLANIFGDNGHVPDAKIFDGRNVYICSLHFRPNDFVYQLNGKHSSLRNISQAAVPSVFPWSSDWESNYQLEMEMSNGLSNFVDTNTPSTSPASTDTLPLPDLPDGEVVEIGSVESLGINRVTDLVTILDSSDEDDTRGKELVKPNALSQSPLRSNRTPSAKRKREISREDDVKCAPIPSLFAMLQYSCGECVFKTADIVALKQHRILAHSQLETPIKTEPPSSPIKSSPPPIKPLIENNSSVEQTLEKKEWYHCQCCDFSTKIRAGYVSHIKQHTAKSKYKCDLCSYSVSTRLILEKHEKFHHLPKRVRAQTAPHLPTTSESSEFEVEHFCTKCQFKTLSRREFVNHEKSVHSDDGMKSSQLPVGKFSGSNSGERVEREVYCCPKCCFWVRYPGSFHEHFITHESGPFYKCSACDFEARDRRPVTKHVSATQDTAHISASVVSLVTSPPKKLYAKYLQKALVPEKQWIGRFIEDSCPSATHSAKDSDSNGSLSPTNHQEWVPTDSASDADEDYSSSSLKTTSDERPISSSSITTTSATSESKSGDEGDKASTAVKTRQRRKVSGVARKSMRIMSDDSNDSNDGKVAPEVAPKATDFGTNPSLELVPYRENRSATMYQEEIESGQTFFSMKPEFPLIAGELAKRQKIKRRINELQKNLEQNRVKMEAMEAANGANWMSVGQLRSRRDEIRSRQSKLNSRKIGVELQVRMHQCKELKLRMALSDSNDQHDREITNDLNETKRLIADAESELKTVLEETSSLQQEYNTVCRQLENNEESRTTVSQLFDITRSEMVDMQSELKSCTDQLIESSSRMVELMSDERQSIRARASCCETELEMAYMRALSKTKQTEKDWLDALDDYVKKNEGLKE